MVEINILVLGNKNLHMLKCRTFPPPFFSAKFLLVSLIPISDSVATYTFGFNSQEFWVMRPRFWRGRPIEIPNLVQDLLGKLHLTVVRIYTVQAAAAEKGISLKASCFVRSHTSILHINSYDDFEILQYSFGWLEKGLWNIFTYRQNVQGNVEATKFDILEMIPNVVLILQCINVFTHHFAHFLIEEKKKQICRTILIIIFSSKQGCSLGYLGRLKQTFKPNCSYWFGKYPN